MEKFIVMKFFSKYNERVNVLLMESYVLISANVSKNFAPFSCCQLHWRFGSVLRPGRQRPCVRPSVCPFARPSVLSRPIMTRSFVSPLSRPIQGSLYRQRLRSSATYCQLCSEVSRERESIT